MTCDNLNYDDLNWNYDPFNFSCDRLVYNKRYKINVGINYKIIWYKR